MEIIKNAALAIVLVLAIVLIVSLTTWGAAMFIYWEKFVPDLSSWATWRAALVVMVLAIVGGGK